MGSQLLTCLTYKLSYTIFMIDETSEINPKKSEPLEDTAQRVSSFFSDKFKSNERPPRVSYSMADEHIFIGDYVSDDGIRLGEVRVYPVDNHEFMLFLNMSPNLDAALELGKLLQGLKLGVTRVKAQDAYNIPPEEEDKYSELLKDSWEQLKKPAVTDSNS